MHEVVFHVPRSWLSLGGAGLHRFYLRVTEGLEARGIPFEVAILDRETLPETVEADHAIHVIHHGRFAHPRARNADVAYIYPFWNFDPQGIRAFSSIADKRFVPDDVDPEVARPFFRRVRQRIVGRRTSRYDQPEAVTDPGTVRAAVFLQSEGHRVVGETCYLDRWEMLSATCAAVDGPVMVKTHPRDSDPATSEGLREMQARFPHLQVSDGNIHDLIAAADRVITINSAVGVEAYLHRKPVILCGRADFHHVADVAQSADALRNILQRPPKRRAYDKFVWWYFGDQCLDVSAPDLVDRFCARTGL
ncbi:hypothetical protein [uncultured Tateyamaria sp.]|uniref:capsular polysaccharide export protein, LipB/KpsS family n=1 Tax=Tateyamaria sp. 1078 TaxID=3417464 RepID=UPI002603D57C|nr:hypothetical protein [uncultured Tateyamaria sp.]